MNAITITKEEVNTALKEVIAEKIGDILREEILSSMLINAPTGARLFDYKNPRDFKTIMRRLKVPSLFSGKRERWLLSEVRAGLSPLKRFPNPTTLEQLRGRLAADGR